MSTFDIVYIHFLGWIAMNCYVYIARVDFLD